MTNTGLLAVVLLLFSADRANASEPPLLAQLEAKSASERLMIAGVLSREFIVVPYSGAPFIRRFFNYDLGLARTSPDGTAVLGYTSSDNPGIPARTIALISARGRVTALLNRDVGNIADMAVASDLVSVVFAGKDRQTGEVGIFLGRLESSDIHLIVPLRSQSGVPDETSTTWVPDGSGVFFSRNGAVWIYDINSQRISPLFSAATNPSCSPDGARIAYRSSNGYAMISSKRGFETKRASRWPIDGSVHWSPDSAYYFVDEEAPGSSPRKCPFGHCLVVYRLSDGSRLQVEGTNRKESFFGWLRGREWSVK